ELERGKPAKQRLTSFYLCLSIGGALGGIFVCIAPYLFSGFCEFHVGLTISLLIAANAVYRFYRSQQRVLPIWVAPFGFLIVLVLGMIATSFLYFSDSTYKSGVVFRGRNEYGLASVEDVESRGYRRFVNGQIEHGGQYLDPDKARQHISYYVAGSGVGVAFKALRDSKQVENRNLSVAVLGLGTGAMSTWINPGDDIVFFEINPMVEEIARQYFTYLENCPGDTTVILGDGRIQLKKMQQRQPEQKFDLLFMDAFSSDSIPVHLLTRECMELYFDNLEPDGILVAHITNRFINLLPVLEGHANHFGIKPILVDFTSKDPDIFTRWVLLTRNQKVLNSDFVRHSSVQWPSELEPVEWSDDYASIAALLNWSAAIELDGLAGKIQTEKENLKE
ncbi:MAG: fused MFS/spermidine synthase, partial [Planctomycetota bacterium]